MITARTLISKKNIFIMAGVLIGLLLIGSVSDYGISQALFDINSPFGIIGAGVGEIPALLAWVMSGTLFIIGRDKDRTVVSVFQVIGGSLLIAFGTVGTMYFPTRYLSLPNFVIAALALCLSFLVVFLTAKFARGVDRKTIIRVALVMFAVVLIEMILINIIKIIWERPRMRLIDEYGGVPFQPWWVIGSELKDRLIGDIPSEEFKSFPSGHTGNAATLMMLTVLVALRPAWRKYSGWLLWIGAAFTAVIAVSRIVIGAHFLTDVTLGAAVTFVVILVVYQIAFRAKPTDSAVERPPVTGVENGLDQKNTEHS